MKVLSSIFFPFWNFILRIRDIRSKETKSAFFVLCIWVGVLFIYNLSSDSFSAATVGGTDSSRIALQFMETAHYSGDFVTFFQNRSLHDRNDFFQVTSMYFLSRITSNPRFWFLYISLIFGFFYVNNIWYVLDKTKQKFSPLSVLLVVCLFFAVPITEGLNATRMNLAIQVYLFGMLRYLLDGNKKYIWVSVLSLLVHFSMFLPVVFFILYLFLPKNKLSIYYYLFFVSFFINQLDIGFVRSAISYLPFGLDERTGLYIDDYSLAIETEWREKSSFVYTLASNSIPYAIFILVLHLFFSKDRNLDNSNEFKSLFSFTLILYIAANILSLLPSGYRFLRITNYLMIVFFIMYIDSGLLKLKSSLVNIFLICLLFYKALFSLRLTFDYYGLQMFYGNFLTALFFEDNVPVSHILGL